MENKITARDCLEAELLLGYKYFKQEDAVQTQKSSAQKRATDAVSSYELARQRDISSPQSLPNTYKEYTQYAEAERKRYYENAKKAQRERTEGEFSACKKRIITCTVVCVILIIVGIVLAIYAKAWGEKENGDGTLMIPPLFFLVAIPAIVLVSVVLTQLSNIRRIKREASSAKITGNCAVIDFQQYVQRNYLGFKNPKLLEEYDGVHARDLAIREQTVAQSNAQVDYCNKTLAMLYNVRDNTIKKLNVIPAYYFKKDAVEKMLFFYVNKRADNIKELINLYETTVFQEALLKSLKDIAVSVDKLTDAVRGGFTRLGLQLGVVNESIQENTKQQRLNREKLSEIKDENARHYLDIVDAIDDIEIITNTHVTVQAE